MAYTPEEIHGRICEQAKKYLRRTFDSYTHITGYESGGVTEVLDWEYRPESTPNKVWIHFINDDGERDDFMVPGSKSIVDFFAIISQCETDSFYRYDQDRELAYSINAEICGHATPYLRDIFAERAKNGESEHSAVDTVIGWRFYPTSDSAEPSTIKLIYLTGNIEIRSTRIRVSSLEDFLAGLSACGD